MTDMVNHPPHYKRGGIETLDVLEAWMLYGDMYRAHAVRYIARAGVKHPAKYAEDLRKAVFYLLREADLRLPLVYLGDLDKTLDPQYKWGQLVRAWDLSNEVADALGAILYARTWTDLKVAAAYLIGVADEWERRQARENNRGAT